MNQVNLMGNLVSNLELKQSQKTGINYTQFKLAVHDYRAKDREAEFFDLVAFGKKSEVLVKHLNKGDKVAISGRLSSDSFTNEEGNKRYSTKVIVEDFEFVGYKRASS